MRFGLLGPLEVRTDEQVLRRRRCQAARAARDPAAARERGRLARSADRGDLARPTAGRRGAQPRPPDLPAAQGARSARHCSSRGRAATCCDVDPGDIDAAPVRGELLERGPAGERRGEADRGARRARRARSTSGAGRRSPTSPTSRSLRVEAHRLEELRLAALEERIDAELALGEHHRLVAELDALRPTPSAPRAAAGAADARPVPLGPAGRGAPRATPTRGVHSSTSSVSSPGRSCSSSSRRSCARTRRSPPPRRARLGPSRPDRSRSRRASLAAAASSPAWRPAPAAATRARAPTARRPTNCSRVRLGANRQGDRPHRRAERAAAVRGSSAARSGTCPSTGILSKIDPQTGKRRRYR